MPRLSHVIVTLSELELHSNHSVLHCCPGMLSTYWGGSLSFQPRSERQSRNGEGTAWTAAPVRRGALASRRPAAQRWRQWRAADPPPPTAPPRLPATVHNSRTNEVSPARPPCEADEGLPGCAWSLFKHAALRCRGVCEPCYSTTFRWRGGARGAPQRASGHRTNAHGGQGERDVRTAAAAPPRRRRRR